jgi:cobalt-zinc-cadmium efflux system outer membrane protein
MRWFNRLAAVMVVVLTGCRGAQPGDGFDLLNAEVAARTGGAQLQWNRDADAAAAIDARVDEILAHPLTVDSAVQIALLNNRGFQAMIEELGVARADLIEAGLLQNPVLGVSARFPDTSASTNLEFTVTQSFLELFVVGARKNLAKAEFERSRLQITRAALDLAWETEAAFFTVQASHQLLTLTRSIGEAARLKRELAEKQRAAGNISELDAARQDAAVEESLLEEFTADAEVQIHRERLNRLLGLSGARALLTAWTLSNDTGEVDGGEPNVPALEHQALRDRIELSIARQEAAIVDRVMELAKKGFVTYLDLGVSTEREPEGFWVTGPVLEIELPIFDHRGIQIERIESQQRQARHLLAALETNAMSEVREAAAHLSAARSRMLYLRDSVVPLRRRILNLSQEQYNAMLLGVYELLAARQDEIDAQASLIEASRDYQIARTDLNKAVGGTLGAMSASQPVGPAIESESPTMEEHHQHGADQ